MYFNIKSKIKTIKVPQWLPGLLIVLNFCWYGSKTLVYYRKQPTHFCMTTSNIYTLNLACTILLDISLAASAVCPTLATFTNYILYLLSVLCCSIALYVHTLRLSKRSCFICKRQKFRSTLITSELHSDKQLYYIMVLLAMNYNTL